MKNKISLLDIEYNLLNNNDLFNDAKQDGNYNLALHILDERMKHEVKREINKAYRKITPPEVVTVNILKKLKKRELI